MDDEFGVSDADFLAVSVPASKPSATVSNSAPRLDAPTRPITNGGSKVQQPTPQALPNRKAPSSILVSTRQKGNPILTNIRALPWEYSDIPADYVLGATTCALFLSLKYHRLHPEYVYQRIKALAGKYNLRVLLTMVDITNHEEPLKELSKTSLINNVTIVLCWSAQEAGRYLELLKSYEHAAPTAIKAHQSTGYSDKLVEFITVPRSVNKTDAVSLISSFGSVRTAINAAPEDIALVPGFGEKKVQRWCNTVREPFRVKKAAKRGITRDDSRVGISREASGATLSRESTRMDIEEDPNLAARLGIASTVAKPPVPSRLDSVTGIDDFEDPQINFTEPEPDDDEILAMMEATGEVPRPAAPGPSAAPSQTKPAKQAESAVSDGIAAALAKLRQ